MRAAVVTLALTALASLGCGGPGTVGLTPEGAPIVRVPLRLSNASLLKGRTPILVDSGTPGDLDDLDAALRDNGVRTTHLGLVILTHAHADHAGLASDLRRVSGAKVMVGAGDVEQAHAGHNDPLLPTSFIASVLKPFIPQVFPAVDADLVVGDREPMSLAPWGVDGKVIEMPGHTRGSLVVVLANKTAFVGDMMLGGSFGGELWPHSPGEHYFQADREANRRNIHALLAQGIEVFYLGHGGPVTRADVMAAFP